MVQLASWVNQPQLRCFSGTATYETSITVPGQALAQRPALVVDLGDVRDVAEVWVNGKQVGITWRMPYKLPIGEYLQAGANTLRVDVTNLLINTVLCQPIKDYTEIEKTYQIGTHLRPPEFTFDLPGPLPEQLATAARAGEEHRERIYALCERMRGADDTREGYIERARSVEQQLRLGELTRELPQLGVRDTFPFEERIYLGRLETLAKTGKVAEAREIVERRRRSVWRYLPERAVLWKLAERCVDFLAAAAAGPHRSEAAVRGWIQAYTAADGLWQVDRLQRLVEQGAAACAESEEAAGLVSLCRQRYREVAGKAQAAFLQAVERDGWPPDGVFRQTQTFERYVAPVLEERRKAVYFLVDSMRYEMGRDLGTALDPFGPVSVTAAVTVLPTTTPCGMAALMPGADGTFTLVADGEDLAPAVAGRVLRNSADRMTLLRERYGDRFRDLLSMSQKRFQAVIGNADLVVVRTQEIDALGEGPSLYLARKLMSEILGEIRTATDRLVALGFDTFVYAADHGHMLLPEVAAGDVLRQPPGEWKKIKRRSMLGHSTARAAGVMVLPAARMGIVGPVADFAVATGFKVFRAGEGYFHEGLSLAECLIPIVVLQAREPGPKYTVA
ncbi:MAG: PglZ domain-containing protein [Acidobacteria bacterium]|nr:PglZ domain-containing protein [Acidobacteriota bacterium]